jgi:ribosomal protein L37E
MTKKQFVKICPRCGSKNVDRDVATYNIAPYYICKSCGFGSPLFPEISLNEARKLKDKPINYSPTFAPTKKPISFPLILFTWIIGLITTIILIILSR